MTRKLSEASREKKRIRDLNYDKANKVRINISLNKNTEQDYIDIYETIPNKREWFKQALLDYKDK
jgi:hypothetical protein